MKCVICSKNAKYTHLKIPLCGKLCQYELISGKRAREDEVVFDPDRTLLFHLLLNVQPDILIDYEFVSKKYYNMINDSYFMTKYIQLHQNQITDEFVWWIMNTKSLPIINFVKQNYFGFFAGIGTQNDWLDRACNQGRIDILEILFSEKFRKYQNFSVLRKSMNLLQAARTFNFRMFKILWKNIPHNQIQQAVIDEIVKTITENMNNDIPTTIRIFKKVYRLASVGRLSTSVYYFLEYPIILEMIIDFTNVKTEMLIDILNFKEKRERLMYFKRILRLGFFPFLNYKDIFDTCVGVQDFESLNFFTDLEESIQLEDFEMNEFLNKYE